MPDKAVIRHPSPGDVTALEKMWDRCGAGTRIARFHSPVLEMPGSYLRRVFEEPAQSLVLVATASSRIEAGGSGPIRGLASLFDTAPGRAEFGVLIEDLCQGRGYGSALVAGLLALASARQVKVVNAVMLADNHRAVRLLRRIPGERTVRIDGPELVAAVRLPGTRRTYSLAETQALVQSD